MGSSVKVISEVGSLAVIMTSEDVIASLKGKVIRKNNYRSEYGEFNEWTPYNAELQMQSIKVLVKDPIPTKVGGGSFEDTMLLLEMVKEKQQKENKELKDERIRQMAMEKKKKLSENTKNTIIKLTF